MSLAENKIVQSLREWKKFEITALGNYKEVTIIITIKVIMAM